jgi:hypothetical protein
MATSDYTGATHNATRRFSTSSGDANGLFENKKYGPGIPTAHHSAFKARMQPVPAGLVGSQSSPLVASNPSY